MVLPRTQLFEFNDQPWVPAALRDSVVEALSRTLAWGGVLRSMVGPFQDFLAASGTNEVLDLCAGAAGPAVILADEIERAGARPPRFILTDLYPRLELWEAARHAHPDAIAFEPGAVDATRIAPELGRGRARTIINAFHHFGPELAQAILADAVAGSEGVFISEGFERNPLTFLNFIPFGVPALALGPILSPRERAAKALLAWATPVALAVSAWDGFVSTLRVYSEDELRAMVAPLGDRFRWEYRTYAYPPAGKGYCFYGVPRR
jgi:hypothetical protein